MTQWGKFDSIWSVDYEFRGGIPNPNPTPICYVAENVITGQVIRHWIDGTEKAPEYPTDKKALFLAYYASAEMSCHLALGFERPWNIIDLFAEFRVTTNGRPTGGNSLLSALKNYGIASVDKSYKESMRNRILEGEPYSETEKTEILDYCQTDVTATTKLFQAMKEGSALNDINNALIRGRYMWAVACMERNGIPIDMESYTLISSQWDSIKGELIKRTDEKYHVYEDGVFKVAKFREYIETKGISWKLTPTGLPVLDSEYFKEQVKTYPELRELYELRVSLGQLRLTKLGIGTDGRNRTMLSAFRTLTGRNAPSSTSFIFGPATWIRYLIKPAPGKAIAYIDYEQQELGIAAALSGDEQLIKTYNTGDPYLVAAKASGAIPPEGTKETHREIRDKYKVAVLSIGYGAEPQSIANKSGMTLAEAKLFHKNHKLAYRQYWEWITNFIDLGLASGVVRTRFGWKYQTLGMLITESGKPRSNRTLLNWPMQAHGSEIIRQAAIVCLENGIQVDAPVHDALVIEADEDQIEQVAANAQFIMESVSANIVGMKIRTESTIIRYPDRYTDKRGKDMWDTIRSVVNA